MDERDRFIEHITLLFSEITWRGRQLQARRVAKHGLTLPQFVVLQLLERCGSRLTLGDISDALQLPASSLTSIADRLVARGLAVRDPVPADRRSVALAITDAGHCLVEAVDAERRQDLAFLLQGSTLEDLSRFATVLNAIRTGLERALTDHQRDDTDPMTTKQEGKGATCHGAQPSGGSQHGNEI